MIKVNMSKIGRPRAFLGISFDEKDADVKDWFERLLRICGFEVVTGERSEHEEVGEKIRRKIRSCDVACFVLTPRTKIECSNQWQSPSWIPAEIGMAYDSGKKFAVFAEKDVVVDGVIPYVVDYTRFSRDTLNRDVQSILESVLSLRLPELQDAIETLLNQSEVAPLIVLGALRNLLSTVRDIRDMCAKLPRCSIVALVQDARPILIMGQGENHGVVKGSTWLVSYLRQAEETEIEVEVGRARVFHTQEKISQAILEDPATEDKLKDIVGPFGPDGEIRRLKGWSAKAEDSPLLPKITVAEIDGFVKVINELLGKI